VRHYFGVSTCVSTDITDTTSRVIRSGREIRVKDIAGDYRDC
jgi:hypothetical protein